MATLISVILPNAGELTDDANDKSSAGCYFRAVDFFFAVFLRDTFLLAAAGDLSEAFLRVLAVFFKFDVALSFRVFCLNSHKSLIEHSGHFGVRATQT